MKRRAFFKRLVQAAGIVSLAPRLAFNAPDETFLTADAEARVEIECQSAFVSAFFFDQPINMAACGTFVPAERVQLINAAKAIT